LLDRNQAVIQRTQLALYLTKNKNKALKIKKFTLNYAFSLQKLGLVQVHRIEWILQ